VASFAVRDKGEKDMINFRNLYMAIFLFVFICSIGMIFYHLWINAGAWFWGALFVFSGLMLRAVPEEWIKDDKK